MREVGKAMRARKCLIGVVAGAVMATVGLTAEARIPVAGTQPAVPSDPLFASQWALNRTYGIRADKAWATSDGEAVTVAVIDSGITSHPDLNANVLPGYDFVSEPEYTRDGNGRDAIAADPGDWTAATTCPGGRITDSSWHGTHIAGVIAAVGNNSRGVSGVAPGARLLPVRATGPCGALPADLADAITWASGGSVTGVPANPNPARILNLSLGVTSVSCPFELQRAIDGAVSRGALVLAAAGNKSGPTALSVPANCRGVTVVAATGRTGARASYSNTGAEVDLAAPGGDRDGGILATWNEGERAPGNPGYALVSGTSQATAMAAGAAALVWSTYPQLTAAQVVSVLQSTARPVAGCTGCGKGLVDVSAALVAASKLVPPKPVNVYTTPGEHFVNGRHWRTVCSKYSASVTRCRTDIWASTVTYSAGTFVPTTGWVFNNLTYLPSPRSQWRGNPLGAYGKVGGTTTWTATDGRRWRTECDTAASGRNGCRSYILADVIQAYSTSTGTKYRWVRTWIFNNIVMFR